MHNEYLIRRNNSPPLLINNEISLNEIGSYLLSSLALNYLFNAFCKKFTACDTQICQVLTVFLLETYKILVILALCSRSSVSCFSSNNLRCFEWTLVLSMYIKSLQNVLHAMIRQLL